MAQVAESAATGDSRLAAFQTREGWSRTALLGATVLLSLGVGTLAQLVLQSFLNGGTAPEYDFRVFWGAARLALEGDPLGAFDIARLAAIAGADPDNYLPWLYPPGFLLVLTPIGLLPFPVAWVAFTALYLGATLLALRSFTGRLQPAWLAFALAPAFLPVIILGQNNLLWLAVLLAALAGLRDGRSILAGVLIGLLTIKPQHGLRIPVALVACGAWRTITTATIVAVLAAAGPTLLYGTGYWHAMIEAAARQSDMVFGQAPQVNLLSSLYSFLAGAGVPLRAAMTLQWIAAAAAALLVWQAWRIPNLSFDLRAATLLTAIPLSSPYSWYYDAAILPFAALLLVRGGALEPRLHHRIYFYLFWLGAGPVMALRLFGYPVSARLLVVPLVLTGLAISARSVLWRRPGKPEPAIFSGEAGISPTS